jgi:predicted GNAT family acetyltransferase
MNLAVRILLITLAFVLTSCTSTKLVTSWRDPAVSIDEGKLNKVLMIALIKDQPTRRKAEDRLAELFGVHGEASYLYLGDDLMSINTPGITDRMVKDGIDGVMVLRVVDKNREETYIPGNPLPENYDTAEDFIGYATPMFNDPGYIQTDVTYTVETNVYSTRRNKLVWTGTTNTVNPNGLTATMGDIMKVVHGRMVEEGFLVPAAKAR